MSIWSRLQNLTFNLVSGIVNAGCLPVYDDIEEELLRLCEDILWNKGQDATEKMLNYCQEHSGKTNANASQEEEWRNWRVEKRLEHSLIKVNQIFKAFSTLFYILEYFDNWHKILEFWSHPEAPLKFCATQPLLARV